MELRSEGVRVTDPDESPWREATVTGRILPRDEGLRTTFSERDYAQVRRLGDEYQSRAPRSVQT